MKRALTISDRELWACAQKVIDLHGAGAELHAATRADELLEAGYVDSQRVRKAILARIEEWRREDRPPLRVPSLVVEGERGGRQTGAGCDHWPVGPEHDACAILPSISR